MRIIKHVVKAKKLFVFTNVSNFVLGTVGRQNFVFITFFTLQPLVNYKCENTASKVNTSNTCIFMRNMTTYV